MAFGEYGRPYRQNPDIMLVGGWKPDLPTFEDKIYFDRPVVQ